MTLGQYLRCWLRQAVARAFATTRLLWFVISVAIGLVLYFAPGLSDVSRNAGWVVPLVVFLALLVPEIATAPYRLHLKVIADRDGARAELAKVRLQLEQHRPSLFIDRTEAKRLLVSKHPEIGPEAAGLHSRVSISNAGARAAKATISITYTLAATIDAELKRVRDVLHAHSGAYVVQPGQEMHLDHDFDLSALQNIAKGCIFRLHVHIDYAAIDAATGTQNYFTDDIRQLSMSRTDSLANTASSVPKLTDSDERFSAAGLIIRG